MPSWIHRGPFAGGSLRGVLLRLAIATGVVIAFLGLAAIGGVLLTATEYRDAAGEALARQQAADQVLVDLLNAETGNRGYTLTGAGIYLTPYLDAIRRYEDDMRELERQVRGSSPELIALATRVDIAARLWFAEARQLIGVRRRDGPEAARIRISKGTAKDRIDDFRAAHTGLIEAVADERDDRFALADDRRGQTIAAVLAAGLLALAVTGIATVQMWRRMGGPLAALSDGMNRVMRGRLSVAIPNQRNSVREITDLVDGFNDMQRQVSRQNEAVAAAARREAAQATERQLWETVQSELLPEKLPCPPGLRIAARYQPAEKGLLLGGDFYDAIRLPDGRLAVMVGDMAGHGAPAAARATGLRFAWRTLVLANPEPCHVMSALNTQMTGRAERAQGLFASLIYALIGQDGSVSYAPAGHPPPFVLDAAGCGIASPAFWGPLLGVLDSAEWPVTDVTLGPGDTLVFYTDGLIEARAEADLFGAERCCRILEQERRSAVELRVERLIEAARRHDANHLGDDVVVLAVERVGRPTGFSAHAVELPPASVESVAG